MIRGWWLALALFLAGCGQESGDRITLVFKHGKVVGDPAPLQALLREFEERHPKIRVRDEMLPSSTDEQHQFYVLNLEGRSADFDVFALDVIWVPEFAHAGWLRDISHLLPPKEREAFFPGPIRAVVYQGKVYAIPWYIDAGLLYYRKDLLEARGFSP
ncbi:MAG: extracellular solute-binding protein, partial [Gammaproteobacteria bacterium]